MKITVAEYDPGWPELYRREADRIRAILGPRVLLMEHSGSTAVPGLPAKPVIDMLLAVSDSADEAAYLPPLTRAGYTLRFREPDWYEHRLLRGPDTEINLHVFSAGCPEISKVLLLRDWLRTHPADRDLYARAKLALAERDWESVDAYANAKTPIVAEMLARAGHPLYS